MKKIAGLILILITIALISGCNPAVVLFEIIEPYDKTELTDTELVLENEYLRMDFDCETTQFTLTDKTTGKVWYSNPPEADNDPTAISAQIDRMKSQIVLTYGQISGTVIEQNNYTNSIVNETYKWEKIDNNNLRVSYTIGKVEKVFIVPPSLTEDRFTEYYEKMDIEQQGMLNNYFRIISLDRLRPTDNKDELVSKYPELEKGEKIYELREELQPHIMERIETAFEAVGYTAEDFMSDNRKTDAAQSDAPVFNITLIYTLDGHDFSVSVPLEEMEFRHSYPPLTLSVLPYFGAGGTEDEGFMFVPDASGAIINFNNNKHNQQPYVVNLYGFDTALKRSVILSENFAYMPLFGVSNGDDAFLCIIESGDERSTIEAYVSGMTNSYNSVNARYTIINWDDADIAKANVVAKAFDRTHQTDTIKQRYRFLSSSSYVDMAQAYRSYLMEKYPTLTRHNETELQMVLGLIGAIDKTENTLGVPMSKAFPLTTYSESQEIILEYINAGVNNLRVNNIGWFNGGVMHTPPGKVKIMSQLGGKRDFKEMISNTQAGGAEMYFEADFTFISNSGAFNGFGINRDSARNLARDSVRIYPYSFVWYGEWSGSYARRYSHYLANPEYTSRTVESFHSDLQELGGSNVTFGSIGRSLNSDFNVKKPASRKAAMENHKAIMEELTNSGSKIMIHGGNLYAVPYADMIIDMADSANNFNIVDESIPFYQIVLHGLVPYTSNPINLAPDFERSILKAVETGAGLQFIFMNEPGESLLLTYYTRYFASDINRWGNEPIEIYNRLNNDLAHTTGLFITGHEKLASQVTLTEYEDGTKVIVNYSSDAFEYNGVSIDGMDYKVIEN